MKLICQLQESGIDGWDVSQGALHSTRRPCRMPTASSLALRAGKKYMQKKEKWEKVLAVQDDWLEQHGFQARAPLPQVWESP